MSKTPYTTFSSIARKNKNNNDTSKYKINDCINFNGETKCINFINDVYYYFTDGDKLTKIAVNMRGTLVGGGKRKTRVNLKRKKTHRGRKNRKTIRRRR